MSDEIFWGPWLEHNRGPRPVPRGTFCHLVYKCGAEYIGPAGVHAPGFVPTPDGEPWGGEEPVIRYRVRRNPSTTAALEALKAMARNPERVREGA